MSRTKLIILVAVAAALGFSGTAGAQTFPVSDVYKVDYFDNANTGGAPDATVRIVNPGTDPFGDRCALIYVFDSAQELKECCGCRITPNGLLTLSVNSNLTSNPVSGGLPTRGVIKIVSTLPSGTTAPKGSDPGCEPGLSGGATTTQVPTPTLRAWATHIQSFNPVTPFLITETASQDATLGFQEFADQMTVQCAIIEGVPGVVGGVGSGAGLCNCPGESNTTTWGAATPSAPALTTPTMSAPKVSAPAPTGTSLNAPKVSAPTSATTTITPKLSASAASPTPRTQR